MDVEEQGSPRGAPAAARGARSVRAWTWGLLGVGVLLRVQAVAAQRSLWVDEARLALNLMDRSPAQLFAPLDWNQAAPVGFLLVQKLAMQLGGVGELALRAWPLAAGLASLVLFAGLARRTLPAFDALLALALFALAEPLVYYAGEAKQYSTDVLVVLALALAALPAVREGLGPARTAALALLGAVALWLSHTAVFACAGIGLALLAARGRRRAEGLAVGVLAAVWALSFAAVYRLSLAGARDSDFLQGFWSDAFVPLLPRSVADWQWFPASFVGMFQDPAGLALPGLAAAAFLVGVVSAWRREPGVLGLLLLPVLAALGAATLQVFPFPTSRPTSHPYSGRLVLFIVPSLLWLVGHGVGALRASLRPERQWIAAAVAVLLLVHPVLGAVQRVLHPPEVQAMRPVVENLTRRLEPGDQLLVYHEAIPALLYYARRAGMPLEGQVEELRFTGPHNAYRTLEDAAQQGGRLWLVFAHHGLWPSRDEERLVSAWLVRHGRRIDALRAPGVSLQLYLMPGDR